MLWAGFESRNRPDRLHSIPPPATATAAPRPKLRAGSKIADNSPTGYVT
jgi:hypothetical protein